MVVYFAASLNLMIVTKTLKNSFNLSFISAMFVVHFELNTSLVVYYFSMTFQPAPTEVT